MESRTTPSGSGGAGAGPQQFYVTHCIRTDSVLNTVGFSVRAASSKEPTLLRTAMEYPAYELPMELWGRKPGRADAPRRLARVKTADGTMIVHSGYLEKDTLNRDRSYFTHLMLLPRATAADVLKSWNAPEWISDYGTGKNQTLPSPSERLPTGSAISDAALKSFLSEEDLGPGGCLAMGVWSDKLKGDRAGRRLLTARMLHGVLLALNAPNRGRLYVHAEPGLVALLAYAAARLLPPTLADDLTFTTFEPAHRGLRLYQRALVVGTYLATTAKGLDAELATARGFVLDTITPERSSKELLAEPPAGLVRLVDLAAAGSRKSIDSIRALCDGEKVSPADITRAVALSEAYERLEARTHTADDLLQLQRDPQGRKAVAALEKDLWPSVKTLAIRENRKDVLEAFKPWFASRQDELLASGFKRLAADRSEEWTPYWGALCAALGSKPAVGAAFNRLLLARSADVTRLAPASRLALRNSLADAREVSPEALAPLLSVTTVAELDALQKDESLPAWCRAYSVTVARLSSKPELQARAKALVAAMDADMLGEYAAQVRKDHRGLVEELFDIDAQGAAPNMDRLLNTGSTYASPEWWMAAAATVPLFQTEDTWWSVLTKKQRLAKFLRAVGAGAAGRPAWEWTAMRIDRGILDPGTESHDLFQELDRGEKLLANDGVDTDRTLPAIASRKLECGRLLHEVAAGRGRLPEADPLRRAFSEFGLDEVRGLRKLYERLCGGKSPEGDPDAYDRIAALCGTYFPPSETHYQANNNALKVWLNVTQSCDPNHIPAVHAFFFADSRLSPSEPRRRLELLDETREPPLAKSVEADVRIESNRELHRPAATRKAKKKSTGLLKWFVLAGVLLAVGAAVAFWPKGSGSTELAKNEKKEKDTTPAKPEPEPKKPDESKKPEGPKKPEATKRPEETKKVDPPPTTPKPEVKPEPPPKDPPPPAKAADRYAAWKAKDFPKDATPDALAKELEDIAMALGEANDPVLTPANCRAQGLHRIVTAFAKDYRRQFDDEYGKAKTLTFEPPAELGTRLASMIELCKRFQTASADVSPSWKTSVKFMIDEREIEAALADSEARRFLVDTKKRDPESNETWKARIELAIKALEGLDPGSASTRKLVQSRAQATLHDAIPLKLALDDKVQIQGIGPVDRKDLGARFDAGKKEKDDIVKLTDDPEKQNEEDLPKRPKFVGFAYKEKPTGNGSPTPESKRALEYFKLRREIANEADWTHESAAKLFAAMKKVSDTPLHWNQMKALGKNKDSNVFTKLSVLNALIKENPKAMLLPPSGAKGDKKP